MKNARKRVSRFAICLDNSGYPASLELHKIDPDAPKDGDLRVIDESGDYLYPAGRFAILEVPKAVEHALLKASWHTALVAA